MRHYCCSALRYERSPRQLRLAVALSATSKRMATMVMSAKADLTHVCWALRPAASQTLQQSASAEDQLHLAFSRGHLSKMYHKNQKGGDIMLQLRRVTTTL